MGAEVCELLRQELLIVDGVHDNVRHPMKLSWYAASSIPRAAGVAESGW